MLGGVQQEEEIVSQARSKDLKSILGRLADGKENTSELV